MRFRLLALLAEARELYADVPRRMIRWARDIHQPLGMDDPDRTVLCSWCSNGWTGKFVTWPCDEYVRADERLEELSRE